MTAEMDVDVHGEVSKYGGLDLDMNTIHVNVNVNGNGKDDGDGSYVFVTGDGEDSVANTDLGEATAFECCELPRIDDDDNGNGKEEEKSDFKNDLESPESVVSGSVSDENVDGLSVDHAQESVEPGDQTTPEQNENGSSEHVESLTEVEVVNGSVSDDNVNGLPADHAQESLVSLVDDQITHEQNENGSFGHAKSLTDEIPLQGQLEENLESAPCPVAADIQLETESVTGPVSDENGEGLPIVVSDQVDVNQNESSEIAETVEGGESLPTAPINDTIVEPDVESGDSTITEDFSASADDVKTETEVETADSHPVDCTNVEPEVNGGPANDVNIESEVSEGVTECAVSQSIPVNVTGEESCVSDSVDENESRLPTCSGGDVKSEPEVDNAPAVTSRDMAGGDGIVAESQVLNGSDVNSESAPISVPGVVHVENGEIQFTSGDSDDKTCQEIEGIDGIHREETSTSSPEDSTVDALEGQNVEAEVEKRPFYFLIRVPRYDDESLKEQIKHAQLQVDQKTQSRDAIRVQMQMERATCKEYGEKFDATISEERAARDLLKSKRKDIDSIQSKINIVKNAMSVEDIDGRIRNLEHMIEHETLPLKEEKQFIREIKQLKQHREQISSNMGKRDEVQQALDQKDQIEERLKILRKEADSLREKFLKAEAVTQAAKKKYYEESDKLNKLHAQFKAADDIRQEAYTHLHSLRKQSYEKNKHFWKYRDDVKAANDLALKGDREALQHLCVNQVDRVMELLNNNDEFRKDYIRCNLRSTVRRLKTLDGRSLGPDEEPPVIPYVVNERAAKDNSVILISASKGEKQEQVVSASKGEKQEQVVPVEAVKKDDKPVAKVGEQKTQTAKSKKLAKPAPSGNGLATVSGRDEIQEVIEEEPKQTKEEEELAKKAEELVKKAEELRKEEEAAKLKEQLRLEEKAKAKEASERKKRNADKAQARASLRALKEAEQKEKEREKKARKKEKRKVGTAEDIIVTNEGESAPSSETPVETPKESETIEKPTTMTKRPQKPTQFTKQTKAKSIPLPLRNRSKKRMQSWMWVLLAALVVFALFLLGNSSVSYKFGLQRFFF